MSLFGRDGVAAEKEDNGIEAPSLLSSTMLNLRDSSSASASCRELTELSSGDGSLL